MNPLTLVLGVDMWRLGLFYGMLICLILFIANKSKDIGWIAASLWGYVLCSALIIIEYPAVRFGIYNTAFMASAGQTFAEVLLIPMVIIKVPQERMKFIFKLFKLVIIFEIIAVWTHHNGLMIAPSFNTTLIALFIPFAGPILAITSIITILFHHGSTAMMVLLAQGLVYAYQYKRFRLPMIAIIPVIVGAAIYHSNGSMLDGSERLIVWKSLLHNWWVGASAIQLAQDGHREVLMTYGGTWLSRLFGNGPGSFLWLSLLTEPTKRFFHAHSEPVQIVLDLGIVGLTLVAATALKALKNVRGNVQLQAAIIGCVAACLTYHVLRFAPSAILIGFIFKQALKEQDT